MQDPLSLARFQIHYGEYLDVWSSETLCGSPSNNSTWQLLSGEEEENGGRVDVRDLDLAHTGRILTLMPRRHRYEHLGADELQTSRPRFSRSLSAPGTKCVSEVCRYIYLHSDIRGRMGEPQYHHSWLILPL